MLTKIKENYQKDPLFFYLCAAALALFIIKLYHLAYQSLWLDEGFYILAAKKILKHGYPLYPSGHTLFKSILYSYILAGFTLATGDGVFTARLLSLILHILTPVVVYRIGSKHLPKAVLFAAGILILLGTWETEYARTALYYSLVQVLITLAMLLFVGRRLFADKKHFAPLWVGACLSHQLGMGLAFAFPAFFLMYPRQFFKRRNLLSLLWWVPFFAFIMLQEVLLWKVGQVYVNQSTTTAGGLIQYFFRSFKTTYIDLFNKTHPYSFKIFMVGFIILLGIFILKKYRLKKEMDKTSAILLFLALWLFITLIALGLMRTHPMPRYLFPFHFLFIIIVVGFVYLILTKLKQLQYLRILQKRWVCTTLLLVLSYIAIFPVSIPKTLAVISRDYTDPVSTDIIYTSGRPFPVDHQSLGKYVKENINDTDVVVAIHMIFQYLEVGRVNYWLFTGGAGTWDAWEKVDGQWRDVYLGIPWIHSLQQLKETINRCMDQNRRVWIITSNSEAKPSHIQPDIERFLWANNGRIRWISRDGIGKVYLFSTEKPRSTFVYQASWGLYKTRQLSRPFSTEPVQIGPGNDYKTALIYDGPVSKRLYLTFRKKSTKTILALSTIRLGKIETTRLISVKGVQVRILLPLKHKGRYALQIKHVQGPPAYLKTIEDKRNE